MLCLAAFILFNNTECGMMACIMMHVIPGGVTGKFHSGSRLMFPEKHVYFFESARISILSVWLHHLPA